MAYYWRNAISEGTGDPTHGCIDSTASYTVYSSTMGWSDAKLQPRFPSVARLILRSGGEGGGVTNEGPYLRDIPPGQLGHDHRVEVGDHHGPVCSSHRIGEGVDTIPRWAAGECGTHHAQTISTSWAPQARLIITAHFHCAGSMSGSPCRSTRRGSDGPKEAVVDQKRQ